MGRVVLSVVLMTADVPLRVADSQQSPGVATWKQLQCGGRPVARKYVNYAEGFSVAVPRGLVGRSGQAAGPERGVSVPLSPDCEGVVVVDGEPNSLEWQKPEDAIAWAVAQAIQDDPRVRVVRHESRLGPVRAAGVTLRSERTGGVDDVVVAFRPGGGPVYTARLSTTATRYVRDRVWFAQILRSFRLEEWR